MTTEYEMRDFFERIVTAFVGLSSQSEELAALRPTLDRLQREVQALTERVVTLEATESDLRFRLAEEVNRNEAAEDQVNRVTKERDFANDSIKELQDSLSRIQVERDNLKTERDDLEHRFRVVSDEREALDYSLQQARTELEAVRTERDALAGKLEQVSAVFRSLAA